MDSLLSTVASAARTNSGITRYSGAWTRNEAVHLLKRSLFGSPKKDVDIFATLGLSAALDRLLDDRAPLPAPPVNEYNSATVTDPRVPVGSTWVNDVNSDGTIQSLRRASLKKWWTGVMLNQEATLREKMTLFWINFFGTEMLEFGNANWAYKHQTLLRTNALGNFKQMVRAITTDVAMLRYLNGYVNTATAPDENYARELQELYTLGKGPEVKYTEADVRTAARVLTGWRINTTNYTSFFDPARHDTGAKTFSSYYGGKTITGKTGAAGATETDELIDMIFQKEEVSKFICRRLYKWFVYYKIDAAVELNVIEPLAKIFRDNNFELKPVLRALLQSQHFFDVLNQGCFIKSPVDFIVGAMREFSVAFPPASSVTQAHGMWNYIRNWFASLNQDIGDPPDVSGWPAYYQAPQFHEIWITADTLPKRNRFTDTMVTSGYTLSGQKIVIDGVALARTLPDPADPNKLIDDILEIIYRVPLSAEAKAAVKRQILLSNQIEDYHWTNAWDMYIANPTTANFNIVNTRLRSLLQYFMNLPEYQLS